MQQSRSAFPRHHQGQGYILVRSKLVQFMHEQQGFGYITSRLGEGGYIPPVVHLLAGISPRRKHSNSNQKYIRRMSRFGLNILSTVALTSDWHTHNYGFDHASVGTTFIRIQCIYIFFLEAGSASHLFAAKDIIPND